MVCALSPGLQTVCRGIENDEASVYRRIATLVRPRDSIGMASKAASLFEDVDLVVGMAKGPERAEAGNSGTDNGYAFLCHIAKDSRLFNVGGAVGDISKFRY